MQKSHKKTPKNLANLANLANLESLKNLERQFAEYIEGKRKKFSLSEIGLHSDLRELVGTDLQKSVWRELLNVPYGKVISYEDLAKRVGKPKAVRAVASAVGSNPLCIVIPCHRVLPKSSVSKLIKNATQNSLEKISVGNYSFGSELKAVLLNLELK
ncbi:MAG: methylated-DNA--[protein]-cysteine S-methyltransferase [Candidatus Pacebacteria bacterium]|nr:methylated-DNA--[protein]-cysteine S-methyltransferase [Candidatus Paceibacterota bacterium]